LPLQAKEPTQGEILDGHCLAKSVVAKSVEPPRRQVRQGQTLEMNGIRVSSRGFFQVFLGELGVLAVQLRFFEIMKE
jgi:hypothetical protein